MGLQSNTWGFGLEPKQFCLSHKLPTFSRGSASQRIYPPSIQVSLVKNHHPTYLESPINIYKIQFCTIDFCLTYLFPGKKTIVFPEHSWLNHVESPIFMANSGHLPPLPQLPVGGHGAPWGLGGLYGGGAQSQRLLLLPLGIHWASGESPAHHPMIQLTTKKHRKKWDGSWQL